MRRRDFIAGLAGAMVVPCWANAQSAGPMRRIGVLMALAQEDTEAQSRVAAFVRGLQQAGWAIDRNAAIDIRWTGGGADELRKSATELVKLAPDVVLAGGSAAVLPLLQVTRSIPIVFVETGDPVGAGFVATLMRPGGNATGFARPDMVVRGDWLDLLKQVSVDVKRVAVLRDPTLTSALTQFAAVQSTARSLGIDVIPIDVRDAPALGKAIADFVRSPGGVLVVTAGAPILQHRDLIVSLAARYKLPAVYGERRYPVAGGLLSIGPDLIEEYRLAADSADRILKGDKPAEMPVRASAKIRLVINNKTAKALGLVLPPALLARADEVIE